jgi:hypothetical protein
MQRIYLLSPAHCGGPRARLLLSEKAEFELARKLRAPGGAPLSEVFTFLSGLYFRGKVAYARAFSSPPPGLPGALVITPRYGLRPPEEAISLPFLRRLASVPIDPADPRYRRPLLRDAERLAAAAGPECLFILLGSVATGKYLDLLTDVFGDRLRFPAEFVGRGDMSRGGLMLPRGERSMRGVASIGRRGGVRSASRAGRSLSPCVARPWLLPS